MSIFSFLPTGLSDTVWKIFMFDLNRYLIGAGGVFLLINILLKRRLQHRKIRPQSPSWRQILIEFLVSLRTVVIFSCVGIIIWLGQFLSLFQIYERADQYGWFWFVCSVLALIILHDTWFYWLHRLLHRPTLFRHWHLRHHRSHNPSPFTAYSFDTGEAILTALYFPLVLVVLPVSELAAFIFTTHMMLINALHHCGVEVYPRNRTGKPLFDWLTTTTHHDLHHAQSGYNFGLYFTFWDRIMGTEHPDYHDHFAQAVRPVKPDVHNYSRKAALLLVPLVLGLPHQPSSAANPMQAIAGNWVSEGYSMVIKLQPCAQNQAQLCGQLLWAWDPQKIKPGSWQQPMLTGFVYNKGVWRNGQLIHPVSGQIFTGKIQQRDQDSLKLEGCTAHIFCQQQIWRRLATLPHLKAN